MPHYLKYPRNETTGDPVTDVWGTATLYYELNEQGEIIRQLEIYENGYELRYDESHKSDEYGMLADHVVNDPAKEQDASIDHNMFELLWEIK